ncbi:MAG: hypothetical protein EPO09_04175 [Aquabacterium sp.]|uniref:hypothetical protein n=1 Tax=Aquabacterium sp. TaxID=1872578 RepID=UPI001227D6B4|nr:hypothetical protein [Aquabacterium sp.]TAK97379.1 MAG: hypothetical protein EPO09_04175 [Aquabacterium sp.]
MKSTLPLSALCALVMAGFSLVTEAQATLANMALPPKAVAVQAPLAAPPKDVEHLKFQDMFKAPVGPQGLEPSARLLSLHGRKVRMVGYMATQEESKAGMLILAPMPVNLGDEDESLSDDLPGNAVFVHLARPYAARLVPNLQGLLQFTGTLSVGAFEEADGHVSAVRLELDEATSRLLTTQATTSKPAAKRQRAAASRERVASTAF